VRHRIVCLRMMVQEEGFARLGAGSMDEYTILLRGLQEAPKVSLFGGIVASATRACEAKAQASARPNTIYCSPVLTLY